MPVTMDGLSSGIKTDEIVKKLRDAEQKKVDAYDKRVEALKYQNIALDELRKMSLELQKSLESLYNFDSPFEKKLIETLPEGFIEGVANKNATYGQHKISVKNLAQRLSIASNEIKPDENLPQSDVTINDKTAHFKGGNISDFHDFLNSEFSKNIAAKQIQKTPNSTVLIIESKEEGKKGLLKFSDSAGLFKKLELSGSGIIPKKKNTESSDKNVPREDFESVPFDLSRLSVLNEGPASIGENQKSMTLAGNSSRRLDIISEEKPGRQIKAITIEIEPKNNDTKKSESDSTPAELTIGPVNTINIKGILLNTYNVSRERDKEPEADVSNENFDYGVALEGNLQSLKKNGSLVNIPIRKLPSHIDFFTKNKEVIFKNVQLVYSIKEIEKKDTPKNEDTAEDEDLLKQKSMYPHILNPAKDALINVDGIDIERDKNKDLSDVVVGATIELKQPTTAPITLNIKTNEKKSMEMVADFIKKYNDLLDYSRNISSGVKKNADGKIETLSEDERKQTPLITSSLVRSLVSGLQMRISNAYPANEAPFIRILPMIGIGTGKPNSSWQEISNMHLRFEDEGLFKEMINKHPSAVKDFFGQDKNGDRSFDDGLAYQMVQYLKGYTTQLKQGVIQSQMLSNESRIKDLLKDKDRKQAIVDENEKKMKIKFGIMESVISKQKQTGNALKQKFKNDD
ncbi:MAG: flagellar filament capping protein FliD [Spirochaetia bacterium]|nr:flagellar filament capping protein FliD [Spirochaetia bacterium]